jgi:Tol biopolymer transport system component
LLFGLSAAFAGDFIERVSVSSAGAEGNQQSSWASVSADGRFVAFWSSATNLVAGDTNGDFDAFVHDRAGEVTERVSVSSAGVEGDLGSFVGEVPGALSDDGRYVAFTSCATNLVAGDTNGWSDIFVRDRLTGTTTRVSVDSQGNEGNNCCWGATLSADGRYVAFTSCSSNLVADDTNGYPDIFVHDCLTGTTERVSLSATDGELNWCSRDSTISGDGRYVAFETDATNTEIEGYTGYYPADINEKRDVLVRDRVAGTTELISQDPVGCGVCDHSYRARISADGRWVAYDTADAYPIGGTDYDTNGVSDVFLWDRVGSVCERVSLSATGGELDDASLDGSVSGNGQRVAFESDAGNTGTVADFNNIVMETPIRDILVRDRAAGTTEAVSVDNYGCGACVYSDNGRICDNGAVVAWESEWNWFVSGDTNGVEDVFTNGPAIPEVVLEVHPNERGPGPTAVNKMPGLDYWTWPVLGSGSSYTWKEYDFAGSGNLWIQVCAQNFSAFQNSQNGSLAQEDLLKLTIDGIVPTDFWGIQSGAPGSYQWKGSAEKGTRVTLEFLPVGLSPGLHQLTFDAQMSPIIYWVKVHDLEPR